MVRHAGNPRVLTALLSTPVVTGSHLMTAAELLGAEAVLPQAIRSRCNPKEVLLPLIDQLDHRAARRVAMTDCDITPHIRRALIHVAARPPAALSNRSDNLTEAEREVLYAVSQAWHDDVWALLEAAPARPLWPELVRDADSGRLITNLLLNRADDLDDQELLTCLQSAFPNDVVKDVDEDDLFSGVFGATLTLSRVASIAERHPRAFLLHGPTLRKAIATATGELTHEIREKGIYEGSWDVFEALAGVCTSPTLLADAAQCLSQATPPTWQQRQPPSPKWNAARSQAADALSLNPFCPTEALALLTPFLTDTTAAHFVEHPDEHIREAAKRIVDQAMERIHQTDPAPQQRHQLTPLTAPTDEALAQQDDPAAVLSSLLPLKGAAARRREIATAILDSRYADACHLRQLPAALVLAHTAHASAVAALLIEQLGDHPQAWSRFRSSVLRLTPSTSKTLETLIQEAIADAP